MGLALRVRVEEPVVAPKTAGTRVRKLRFRVARKGFGAGTLIASVVGIVLGYVWLTAELTAQTYRLHDDQARQASLLLENQDLRQRVARLESLPRLEAAAASMHMSVPASVALIVPPQTASAPAKVTAVAASIADVRRWLTVR